MMHGVRLSLGILTLTLAVATSARAEGAGSGELALARELFAEATALEARADWLAASIKLKRALAIKETPGLYYHLAHCEEQLGGFALAARHYERALELIREGASAPDVEPLLPLAVHRVESRVAKLEIVVPPDVTALAELDGQTLPPSAVGASVRVDPGSHQLIVRSPGRRDFRVELALASGEHRTLKVFFNPIGGPTAPRANVAEPPAAIAPEVAERSPPKREGRAAFGAREGVLVGEAALMLAGLGTGVGFAVVRGQAAERVEAAQRALGTSESSCKPPPGQLAPPACAELTRAIADHDRAVPIETAAFIGAGVAGAALVLTWVLWPSSTNDLAMQVRPRESGFLLVAGGSF